MRPLALMTAAAVLCGCGGGGSSGGVTGAGADAGLVGAPDAGGGGITAVSDDPCGGVPLGGRCDGTSSLRKCVVPTGSVPASVQTITCEQGEACVEHGGRAECLLQAACRNGTTRCAGDAQQLCAAGTWSTAATCAFGCVPSAIGAFCAAIPASRTEVFNGTLSYEAQVPNSDRTDWTTTPVVKPGRGFLVAAGFPDPSNQGNYALTDATYTSEADATAGRFSLRVRRAAERTSDDRLLVVAVADDGTGSIAYALADPQFAAPGVQNPNPDKPSPRLWKWGATLNDVQGGDVVIRLGSNSGAAARWDALRAAHRLVEGVYGSQGARLVAWMGVGTSWSCGACQFDQPTVAFNTRFDAQIVFPGDPADQAWWANAVTVHELGHWVMGSFGTPVGEGGTHILGHKSPPGLAWSEGWATFFSSGARLDPLYVDKQQGTFLWIDLDARSLWGGRTLPRPTPAGGLLQNLEENDVSATLWTLSQRGQANAPLFAALASPRLNTVPYKRGYTRHTWPPPQPPGYEFTNLKDTGIPAPALPDMLDALMCAGFPRSGMDAATQPAQFYPYPSGSPLCP